MNRLALKLHNLSKRKSRIRSKVSGSGDRPRLSIFISNSHIVAQIIDDEKQKTLVHSTSVGQKAVTGTMFDKALWVGSDIAKKAKAAKINQVVLDRNGKLYHGRVKALADAARQGGLKF